MSELKIEIKAKDNESAFNVIKEWRKTFGLKDKRVEKLLKESMGLKEE